MGVRLFVFVLATVVGDWGNVDMGVVMPRWLDPSGCRCRLAPVMICPTSDGRGAHAAHMSFCSVDVVVDMMVNVVGALAS